MAYFNLLLPPRFTYLHTCNMPSKMTWFTWRSLCRVTWSSRPQVHASLFAYCLPHWDVAVVSLVQGLLAQQSHQSGHWITPHCSSFRRVCLDIWHLQGLSSVTNPPSISDIFQLLFYSLRFLLTISALHLGLLLSPVIPPSFCLISWFLQHQSIYSAFYSKVNLAQAALFFFMCALSHWGKVAELHSITCAVWPVSDFIPQIRLETTKSQLHKTMQVQVTWG